MANWRRLKGLSWPERLLLAQGLMLLPLMAMGLFMLGLRRWQAVLAHLAPVRSNSEKEEATLIGEGRVVARLIDVAARSLSRQLPASLANSLVASSPPWNLQRSACRCAQGGWTVPGSRLG